MEDTLSRHTVDGELTPERTELHLELIGQSLRGCPSREDPEAVVYIGGPASGKTALREALENPPGAAYLNADEFRTQIPEYGTFIEAGRADAAELVHEEASAIFKRALLAAMEGRLNLVLDVVGSNQQGQLSQRLQRLIDAGYRVRVRCATVAVAEARRREIERAEETGRRVPDEVLREGHRNVSAGFMALLDLDIGLIQVYDTTDRDPRLIAVAVGGDGEGGLSILDDAAWAAFVRKGEDSHR